MKVWLFPLGWPLGGGPDDGGTVRSGAGEGLGVASAVVADGLADWLGLGVGLGVRLGLAVGVGVATGAVVGGWVGAGDGVAAKPPSGERPVPIIQTETSSANVKRKLPARTAKRFIGYSTSEITVDEEANPPELNVNRAVDALFTSSLPEMIWRLAVPEALTVTSESGWAA